MRTMKVIAVLAAVTLATVGVVGARSTMASEADIEPLTGLWCGMTDDGGSIRFVVQPGASRVTDIEIRTFAGQTSSREDAARPATQIKSSQFIARLVTQVVTCRRQQTVPGGPGRCVRAPCRPSPSPGGEVCTNTDIDGQVRGFFRAVDSADGNFSFAVTATRRVFGRYTAWPASVAPCP